MHRSGAGIQGPDRGARSSGPAPERFSWARSYVVKGAQKLRQALWVGCVGALTVAAPVSFAQPPPSDSASATSTLGDHELADPIEHPNGQNADGRLPDLRTLPPWDLSVGWGDTYKADLEGQTLDLGDAGDGIYSVVSISNPRGRLLESDCANNLGVTYFRLRADTVTLIPPPAPDPQRCRQAGLC